MTKQVTIKDPKAVERGKKGWETQLEKIKAKHLEEIKNGGNDTGSTDKDTGNDTGSTGNNTGNSTTILPHVNRYYAGGVLILVVGSAIYFWIKQHSEKNKILPPSPVAAHAHAEPLPLGNKVAGDPKKTRSNFRWGMN